MDIVTIAGAASALLAPYLAKVSEGIATKAGQRIWEEAELLYQTIRRKFTQDQDSYAQETLQRLEDQPTNERRQAALAEILEEKAQADPVFGREVQRLVKNTTQTQGANQFLTQVYGDAKVKNIINVGQTGTMHI